MRGNRTGRGWFKKGQSGNPSGLPKTPPVLLEFAPNTDDPDGADRRTVGNLVVEARKYSGLAVDTLVELTKNTHTDSTLPARRFWTAVMSPSAVSGSASFRRCDHETAQRHDRRRTRRPRGADDRRRTDCAGGNCGSAGRCGRATGRRRRGFPAGCPCLRPRLYSGFRPRPHSVSDSPPIFDAPRTIP